jgi:hypothetical protein
MSSIISNQELIEQLRSDLSAAQEQMFELNRKQQDTLEKLTDALSRLNTIRDIGLEALPTSTRVVSPTPVVRPAHEVIDLTPEFDDVDISDDEFDADGADLLNIDWLDQSEIDRFMRRLEEADLFGSNEEYERVEAECIAESRRLAAQRRGLVENPHMMMEIS